MNDKPSCKSCRFWLTGTTESVCRRFPPQAFFIPGAGFSGPATISVFPGMKADGWCGEYRPDEGASVLPFQPVSPVIAEIPK